jgi:hypothetical protein
MIGSIVFAKMALVFIPLSSYNWQVVSNISGRSDALPGWNGDIWLAKADASPGGGSVLG